jgi:hypothetical protein
MTPIHVYVGYDTREHAAWLVCRDSLLDFQSEKNPLAVYPLSHRDLRRQGLFSRPWRVDEEGQTWDERDGRPFSTEFSHSRFLTPHIAKQRGATGLCVFVDCDFLFFSPITNLLSQIDRTKVVSVVKHDFERVAEGTKMDDQQQKRYFRKLWSSLMVFNLDHPDIDTFHPEHANLGAGATLHGMLHLPDDQIGEISETWNWIPEHSDRRIGPADAVHFSLGGPWLPGCDLVSFSTDWRRRYKRSLNDAISSGNLEDTYALV